MKNLFHKIDMETWPRAQIYHYFAEMVTTTTYSINVTMDVSILKKTLQNSGLKFFPAYLYLISSVIKKRQEFRMTIQDGALGYWDSLNPYYPVFHADDQTIAFLWTAYDENFQHFYQCYLRDLEEHRNNRGVMLAKASPNNFIIACIPWFTFNSLSMHLQNAKNYYAPIFESGGFTEKNGVTTMPLSITVNHATIDGYHIKVFLEELQKMMDHPEAWM